jgi:nitrogen fixation NifU-like protein
MAVKELDMVHSGAPDGYGKSMSDCGDTIEISLYVIDGKVARVGFEVDGCNFTLACARAVAALAKGRALGDVREAATAENVDRAVGDLPEASRHCAELAAEAMEAAVVDALKASRDPWRKLYRT